MQDLYFFLRFGIYDNLWDVAVVVRRQGTNPVDAKAMVVAAVVAVTG